MKQSGIFLLVFLFGISSMSFGQRSQNIRTSSSRVQVEELADSSLVFLYGEMKPGVITYYDGSTSEVLLNYSILLDRFEFQSHRESGHLNFRGLSKLDVEGTSFIYHHQEGFLEVVEQGKYPLYLKRLIRVSSMPVRRGAYGGTDHTSAIDIASNITTESSGDFDRQIFLDNPSGQEMDITLRYNEYFVIGKGESLVKISNQRQLLRDFPEFRNELRNFVRNEKTNFTKPEDLIKLVEYLGTL